MTTTTPSDVAWSRSRVAVSQPGGRLERLHRVLGELVRRRPGGRTRSDRANRGRRSGVSSRSEVWRAGCDGRACLPLAGQRFTAGDAVIEVKAPYDGAVIGAVPSCGAAEVERAVAVAAAAHRRGPIPAWRRAEILDRGAAAGRAATTSPARSPLEAAKPIKTTRVEAERAVSTFQFAAAEARTLAGDMCPSTRRRRARASSASRCACRSASSAPSRRSTSRSTSSPTSWRRPSPPAVRSC